MTPVLFQVYLGTSDDWIGSSDHPRKDQGGEQHPFPVAIFGRSEFVPKEMVGEQKSTIFCWYLKFGWVEILERFVLNVFWRFVLFLFGRICCEFLVAPKMACLFLKVEKFAQKESLGFFSSREPVVIPLLALVQDASTMVSFVQSRMARPAVDEFRRVVGCSLERSKKVDAWKRNTISAWQKLRWSAKRNFGCSWYSSGPTCAVQWSSQICMKPIVSRHVS